MIPLLVLCLLTSYPVMLEAATSSIDNIPGGAGLSYWQAGGGWTTLINVQNVRGSCAEVYAGLYNSDGTRINAFTLPLRPSDNVGIIINGDGFNLYLYDYSDNAYGGSSYLNDLSTGPAVVVATPSGPDGIQRGYLSVVINNTGCNGSGGSPSGSIAFESAVVENRILVRTALLDLNSAFAFNAAMLQNFGNQGLNLSEAEDFYSLGDFTTIPCDVNKDGDTTDVFPIVDSVVGADIDYLELYLSERWTSNPRIMCDTTNGITYYNALGGVGCNESFCGQYKTYWGRYNENPTSGTESMLILVAPQSSHPSAEGFSKQLSGYTFDDDGNSLTWDIGTIGVVAGIPFGSGGIPVVAGVYAGEIGFNIEVPVFGFTFTETASFADIYPLARNIVGTTASGSNPFWDPIY